MGRAGRGGFGWGAEEGKTQLTARGEDARREGGPCLPRVARVAEPGPDHSLHPQLLGLPLHPAPRPLSSPPKRVSALWGAVG